MAENIEEIEKMMAVLLEDPEWIRLMSLALAEIDEDSAEREKILKVDPSLLDIGVDF